MSDLLFKKKEHKPLFEANNCIEWKDTEGKKQISDICISTGDLLKIQSIMKDSSYGEQIAFIKNEFFKLDFDVDDVQLLDQFIEVSEYLRKVLGKKLPR